MNCYAVFLNNKQIRVFEYSILESVDWKRAEKLAFEFALKNEAAGYPCTIEQFNMCSVSKQVYNGEKI